MTDVNIWNRSLADGEVEQWRRCELEFGGNIVDWATAELNVTEGIHEIEIEKNEICGRNAKENLFVASIKKINFDQTDSLCHAIGGKMGVSSDNNTMQVKGRNRLF